MSFEGQVGSVGNGVRRGVPVPAGMTINLPGGRVLDVVHAAPPDSNQLTVTGMVGYPRHDFDRCPICLTPNPTSREHVPQGSIGGRVMTLTCETCNNGLGRAVEGEFAPWCVDASVGTRITGTAAPGRRTVPTIYRRETADGQFVYLVDGDIDEGGRAMLDAGEFTMEFRLPRMPLVHVAALKHAYLAACIALQEVPDTESARRIRREMLAVRDADNPLDAARASTAAANLQLWRSYREPDQHPILVGRDAATPEHAWIVLAGVVCVAWPFTDRPWTIDTPINALG